MLSYLIIVHARDSVLELPGPRMLSAQQEPCDSSNNLQYHQATAARSSPVCLGVQADCKLSDIILNHLQGNNFTWQQKFVCTLSLRLAERPARQVACETQLPCLPNCWSVVHCYLNNMPLPNKVDMRQSSESIQFDSVGRLHMAGLLICASRGSIHWHGIEKVIADLMCILLYHEHHATHSFVIALKHSSRPSH